MQFVYLCTLLKLLKKKKESTPLNVDFVYFKIKLIKRKKEKKRERGVWVPQKEKRSLDKTAPIADVAFHAFFPPQPITTVKLRKLPSYHKINHVFNI